MHMSWVDLFAMLLLISLIMLFISGGYEFLMQNCRILFSRSLKKTLDYAPDETGDKIFLFGEPSFNCCKQLRY